MTTFGLITDCDQKSGMIFRFTLIVAFVARGLATDCIWQEVWTKQLCLKFNGLPFPYGRLETRRKLPSRGSEADCTGTSSRITECSRDEYLATAFMKTTTAELDSGGSTVELASQTRQTVVSTSSRDVLFLIEESICVGRTNFGKFLRLAKALVNSFCGAISIQRDATRIGVATFNKRQYPQMNFDEFFDKPSVINKMENIRYRGGSSAYGACLVDAIQFARQQMFSMHRGARTSEIMGRNERVVILMTYGCGNCQSSTPLEAVMKSLGRRLRRDRIPLITFLVSSNSTNCFDVMKGLSIGSQCYEQFTVPNWAGVDEISEATENNPCMDTWETEPYCGL